MKSVSGNNTDVMGWEWEISTGPLVVFATISVTLIVASEPEETILELLITLSQVELTKDSVVTVAMGVITVVGVTKLSLLSKVSVKMSRLTVDNVVTTY